MESKVIRLLICKERLAKCARSRQQAIENKSFIGAMFFQLEFLLVADEYVNLKRTNTNKEAQDFLKAQFCLDYRNI
jgi:hypothetical protein